MSISGSHFNKILRVYLSFYSCQAESEIKSAVNSGRSSEDESLYQGEETTFYLLSLDKSSCGKVENSFMIWSFTHALCHAEEFYKASVSFERFTWVFFFKDSFGHFFMKKSWGKCDPCLGILAFNPFQVHILVHSILRFKLFSY